jgi:DNA polymerase-3 subunit alpha
MNRRGLESLIQSGALDRFATRGRLLENIELLLAFQKEMNKRPEGQDSLFGSTDTSSILMLVDAEDVEQKQKLAWEKELLGLYVSGHPLETHVKKLKGKPSIADIKTKNREGTVTVIAGIIAENKTILTKNGDKMSFIRLADLSDSIEAVAFPRVLTEHGELLATDSCVLLKGRISSRNDEKSFIIEAVRAL